MRPKNLSKIKIVRENNETELQIRKKSYNALSNLKKLLIRYSPFILFVELGHPDHSLAFQNESFRSIFQFQLD